MNTRPLLAAIAGGLVLLILGYISYIVLFASFFEANAGSAIGASRTETGDLMLHAILAGEIAFAYLMVLIFTKTEAGDSPVAGAKAGGQIGFLLGLGINLIQYGAMNIGTLPLHAVDPLLYALRFAAAGAVIAWILSRAEPAG